MWFRMQTNWRFYRICEWQFRIFETQQAKTISSGTLPSSFWSLKLLANDTFWRSVESALLSSTTASKKDLPGSLNPVLNLKFATDRFPWVDSVSKRKSLKLTNVWRCLQFQPTNNMPRPSLANSNYSFWFSCGCWRSLKYQQKSENFD